MHFEQTGLEFLLVAVHDYANKMSFLFDSLNIYFIHQLIKTASGLSLNLKDRPEIGWHNG